MLGFEKSGGGGEAGETNGKPTHAFYSLHVLRRDVRVEIPKPETPSPEKVTLSASPSSQRDWLARNGLSRASPDVTGVVRRQGQAVKDSQQ